MNNGQFEIDLSGNNNAFDGDGINKNAITQLDAVFKITNQGTQDVDVWIVEGSGLTSNAITYYQNSSPGTSLESADVDTNPANSVTASPGGSSVVVGIQIDITGSTTLGSVSDITIVAEATG